LRTTSITQNLETVKTCERHEESIEERAEAEEESIRQHTSAYVSEAEESIQKRAEAEEEESIRQHT
jgi:hypothetical protein